MSFGTTISVMPKTWMFVLLLGTACHEDRTAAGPMERAGKKIDKAADKTGSALHGAAVKTGNALGKAGRATGRTLEKVGNKLSGDRDSGR